jgi:hypothetical protein
MISYLQDVGNILVPFIIVALALYILRVVLQIKYLREEMIKADTEDLRQRTTMSAKIHKAVLLIFLLIFGTILWYATFLPKRAVVTPIVSEKMGDTSAQHQTKEELAKDAEKRRDPTGMIEKVGSKDALKKAEENNPYRKLLKEGE